MANSDPAEGAVSIPERRLFGVLPRTFGDDLAEVLRLRSLVLNAGDFGGGVSGGGGSGRTFDLPATPVGTGIGGQQEPPPVPPVTRSMTLAEAWGALGPVGQVALGALVAWAFWRR